jgi:AcrR family transcriptional regulator
MARTYTKKRRAQAEDQTRQRIVESAVALHQEEGSNTTITAIAERAGVGRVTVYRHFPDELSLLTACTSHYLALHPPPDLESWAMIADPLERLRHGLAETYAYHRQTEAMMTVAEHEVAANPVLAGLLEPLEAYWDSARHILACGWSDDGHPPPLVGEAIGLALSLPAWRILTSQQDLSDAECVSLFATTIEHLVSQDSAG